MPDTAELIGSIGEAMGKVAQQIVAGMKAMKNAGMTVRAPDYIDFNITVITAPQALERTEVTQQGERQTIVTSGTTTTNGTNTEDRANSGGTEQNQEYFYEEDS